MEQPPPEDRVGGAQGTERSVYCVDDVPSWLLFAPFHSLDKADVEALLSTLCQGASCCGPGTLLSGTTGNSSEAFSVEEEHVTLSSVLSLMAQRCDASQRAGLLHAAIVHTFHKRREQRS